MTNQRIQIFDTLGYGFYFAFSHYGSLLRLTWLPAFLAILIFDAQTSIQLMARRGELPSVGFIPEYTALIAWLPIYLLLTIPAVAVYRMAVFGQRAPDGLAYFRLGSTELQFLAAQLVVSVYMIIYVVLALAIIVPAAFGVHAVLVTAGELSVANGFSELTSVQLGDTVTLWLRIGVGASLTVGLAYLFGLVLFSLVQPVVVAERHIGILRSLKLLWFGNAMRLAVVWFVAGMTLLSITAVLYALAGQIVPGFVLWIFPGYDEKILWHVIIMFNFVAIAPSILIGTLVLGVTAGINGFAYRQIAIPERKRPAS